MLLAYMLYVGCVMFCFLVSFFAFGVLDLIFDWQDLVRNFWNSDILGPFWDDIWSLEVNKGEDTRDTEKETNVYK